MQTHLFAIILTLSQRKQRDGVNYEIIV